MLLRWHLRCRLGCLQGHNALEMQYDELFISFTPRGNSEEVMAARGAGGNQLEKLNSC